MIETALLQTKRVNPKIKQNNSCGSHIMNKTIISSIFFVIILTVSAFFACSEPKAQSATVKKEDLISSELILKDSEYKLVFFGYAHCYHFCDPRLKHIDFIYKALKDSLDVKVFFIDISEESSLDEALSFVKDTNKEFEAINPDSDSIKVLQKKFQDVFIRKLPDDEYLHSGFMYLLKKQDDKYYLTKTYLEFFDTDAVVSDIKNITEE